VARRIAVVILGLAAGIAGRGLVRADEDRPVLRLVWLDPAGVAAGTELAARAEVSSLLARTGVIASWRRAGPEEIRRHDEVWIVLLGEAPVAPGAAVLGATYERHAVAPVAWVRVPNVRSAVGVPRSGSLLGADLHLVAVALGRVIAHEVVHAVVPSVVHGGGLMAKSLDRCRLTGSSIAIDPQTALALRAALRGDPMPAAAEAGELAEAHEEKDR
jgi:hypothetical protein